jgi:hypothetical protein
MEAPLREWLDNIAGPQYASAVMWTVGALILLVIVLFLIRIVRGVSSGTFVAGGRNRRARLAVMDAAAVDNQRRLVLVRRDNVEHLILIGGPTDVVVEQNITPGGAFHAAPDVTTNVPANGGGPAPERPRAEPQTRQEPVVAIETPAPRAAEPLEVEPEPVEPVAQTAPKPAIVPPAPAVRDVGTPAAPSGSVHFLDKARIGPAPHPESAPPLTVAASAAEARVAESRPPETPKPEPEILAPAAMGGRPDPRIEPPHRERREDLDAALQEELKAPLVGATEQPPVGEPSLEVEMKRLLGELSAPARN